MVGEIRLVGVGFAYPARPDVTIFSDFSLVVPAGEDWMRCAGGRILLVMSMRRVTDRYG